MKSQIDKGFIQEFLRQGKWKNGSKEELGLNEELDYEFCRQIVSQYKADATSSFAVGHLALLTLALGVAQWGVHNTPDDLIDPQDDKWKRPSGRRGKHLVSVRLGGVGLPHMDGGYLADFLSEIWLKADPSQKRGTIPKTIQFLSNKGTFDRLKRGLSPGGGEAWEEFVEIAEKGLGLFEVQEWVLLQWVERYWDASYSKIVGAGRDITEVIVNSRIRNSNSKTANCAIEKAKSAIDPVEVQLSAYVKGCPGSNKDHGRRIHYMKRPVCLYNYVNGA